MDKIIIVRRKDTNTNAYWFEGKKMLILVDKKGKPSLAFFGKIALKKWQEVKSKNQ